MAEWANPNNFSAVFRLTSSKYADAFLKTGSIKFNTPQSWIDYAKKYGDGRGDSLEGTLLPILKNSRAGCIKDLGRWV